MTASGENSEEKSLTFESFFFVFWFDVSLETLQYVWLSWFVPSAYSPACTSSAPPATLVGWSAPRCVPPAAALWRGFVKTTF